MFHIPAHKSATAAQVIYPDWAEGLELVEEDPDPAQFAEDWERAFYSNEESREG